MDRTSILMDRAKACIKESRHNEALALFSQASSAQIEAVRARTKEASLFPERRSRQVQVRLRRANKRTRRGSADGVTRELRPKHKSRPSHEDQETLNADLADLKRTQDRVETALYNHEVLIQRRARRRGERDRRSGTSPGRTSAKRRAKSKAGELLQQATELGASSPMKLADSSAASSSPSSPYTSLKAARAADSIFDALQASNRRSPVRRPRRRKHRSPGVILTYADDAVDSPSYASLRSSKAKAEDRGRAARYDIDLSFLEDSDASPQSYDSRESPPQDERSPDCAELTLLKEKQVMVTKALERLRADVRRARSGSPASFEDSYSRVPARRHLWLREAALGLAGPAGARAAAYADKAERGEGEKPRAREGKVKAPSPAKSVKDQGKTAEGEAKNSPAAPAQSPTRLHRTASSDSLANKTMSESDASPMASPTPARMRTLRRRVRKQEQQIDMLKRQLTQYGDTPIEEIVALPEAKERLKKSLELLMEGDEKAQGEFDKWDKFIRLHPDHIAEEAAKEKAWMEENKPLNDEALKIMRSWVPTNIFSTNLTALLEHEAGGKDSQDDKDSQEGKDGEQSEAKVASATSDAKAEQVEKALEAHKSAEDADKALDAPAVTEQKTDEPEPKEPTPTEPPATKLTPAIAKRVWKQKALWLVRAPPNFLQKVHEAELRVKFMFSSLDLIELRALYAVVPDSFTNDPSGGKLEWRSNLLTKLKAVITQKAGGNLPATQERNAAYKSAGAGKELADYAKLRGPFDPNYVEVVTHTPTKSGLAEGENAQAARDTELQSLKKSGGIRRRMSDCFGGVAKQVAFTPAKSARKKAPFKRSVSIASSQPSHPLFGDGEVGGGGGSLMDELKLRLKKRNSAAAGEAAADAAPATPAKPMSLMDELKAKMLKRTQSIAEDVEEGTEPSSEEPSADEAPSGGGLKKIFAKPKPPAKAGGGGMSLLEELKMKAAQRGKG